jgi:TorA maturation chaperone TorD
MNWPMLSALLRLLTEQLGAWISPSTAAGRSGARTAFYRELADLSERCVLLEAAQPGAR